MQIILNVYHIPEKGTFELNIQRSLEINITAEQAQRQVNRWLLNEVSYLMGTEPPTLVIGERIMWRVPAWISFPQVGKAGEVGTIDVDVITGEMNNTPECRTEIERQAKKIAKRQSPFQPQQVSPQYLLPQVTNTSIAWQFWPCLVRTR